MANPADLHAALLDRLAAIPNVTVYDADVPEAPPADPDDGRVYPYAVAWGSGGFTPDQARALDGDAYGGLDWTARVTVAAGDPGWCLQAVHRVRAVLDGHVLTATAGPLIEEPGDPGLLRDPDTTPVRWYVPLVFRCLNP